MFRMLKFLQQALKLLCRTGRRSVAKVQIDGTWDPEQGFDRSLMDGRCDRQQLLQIQRQYVALRFGPKTKAMDGSRRDDDHGRTFEMRLRFLQNRADRPDGHQDALTQNRVPVSPNAPQVFAAAGLNVLDMQ